MDFEKAAALEKALAKVWDGRFADGVASAIEGRRDEPAKDVVSAFAVVRDAARAGVSRMASASREDAVSALYAWASAEEDFSVAAPAYAEKHRKRADALRESLLNMMTGERNA